ncbi:MAG: phosphate/phosphite/phosphonate ABC transporter substrate-binding protein [Candidatus Riflebacteria bacterium]|nr:phosphate/phosphite/phosphonate ABC transporter substrate-binding protein [Candidatus Riflebacteria bacterium]
MPIKSPTRLFRPLLIIASFCLIALMSVFTPELFASKEYPTLRELMETGQLEKEVADEPPVPQSPDFQPSSPDEETPEPPSVLTEEDQTPVAPAPQVVASQQFIPVPHVELPKKVVRIGRVPFMNVKQMVLYYQGLIGFLRKEMGVKDVCIVVGKDYEGVMNALARGTIDFAWLGPMAYVIGSEKIPMIPLAQANRRTGASYCGVFITRTDSKILGIEDIKNKVIGFVDPESASGYLYPLYFLYNSKINPQKYCRKVEFLKKHDAVLDAVLTRKIDVGVCLEDTLIAIKDKKILDQILVLGKTSQVPSDVMACRADCDPALREKFQNALLKIKAANQAALSLKNSTPIIEFSPINDANLDPVRGILNVIDSVRQR